VTAVCDHSKGRAQHNAWFWFCVEINL